MKIYCSLCDLYLGEIDPHITGAIFPPIGGITCPSCLKLKQILIWALTGKKPPAPPPFLDHQWFSDISETRAKNDEIVLDLIHPLLPLDKVLNSLDGVKK